MYSYSVIQWLFFFYFYCFCGWCVESAYVSVKDRKLTNRGFMRGPFLPIYGSGAIMMLVVSIPFQDSIALTYVAGCVGATVLEYVTGVVMEALFKVRYWDYSNKKFNFQGHVCLGTTLSWGVLTILMTEVVHVPVEKLVLFIPSQVLTVMTLVLTAVIFADFALSFKAAIDLRDILVKMEHAKQEMMRVHRRLDAIIALAGEAVENRRDALAESVSSVREELASGLATRRDEFVGSMAELKNSIEGKLENIKNIAQIGPGGYLESVRAEIMELKEKYTANVEDRKRMAGLKDFFQRDLLRSNPSMTSLKFREELEEMKEAEKRKGKEKLTEAEKLTETEKLAEAETEVRRKS